MCLFVCLKDPDGVSQNSQAEMLEKAIEKDSSTTRSASAAEIREAESYSRASKMKQVISGTGSRNISRLKRIIMSLIF